jgi:hypothetical protein
VHVPEPLLRHTDFHGWHFARACGE